MSLLCVRVKRAKLLSTRNEKFNCYACLKVQNVKSSTICVKGIEPVWEQDYMFEISRMDLYLTIEVWNKGIFWDSLVGCAPVALQNVPHSNEEGDGNWLKLYSNVDVKDGVVSGSQDLTPHMILCDIRFEFPSELSDEEIAVLQLKLDQLNVVHDESWMIDRSLNSLNKKHASSSISIESDYHSDASFPLPYHTIQHANSSTFHQNKPLIYREPDHGLRSNSLASNTDESYNPEVGSETESRASDRNYPTEIGSDTEAERYHASGRSHAIAINKANIPKVNFADDRNFSDPNSLSSTGSNLAENALTPARIRWIKVFNKVRGNISGEELDKEKMNELQSKKQSLWSIGLEGCFFANINSKPDIRPRNKSVPFVSDLSIAVMKKQTGLPSALTTTHASLNDIGLKMHVLRTTIQTLIYPASCLTPHTFTIHTVTTPTNCYECNHLLWGLARQCLKCTECGIKCHEKCRSLLNDDCMQRAAEKNSKHGIETKSNTLETVMYDQMDEHENNEASLINFVLSVFNVTTSEQKRTVIEEAKKGIMDIISNWSGQVSVYIEKAEHLQAKDKSGSSDPYVSVQLGKIKKRTDTIFNSLEPEWRTTLNFDCPNALDRIKVRVWDEDDDMKAKFKQTFKRESDDFLGQVIIDVLQISRNRKVSFPLQKRTDKSAVSGEIFLRVNLEVRGEEKVAPYTVQYSCLHENIFQYVCRDNNDAVKDLYQSRSQLDDEKMAWLVYFKGDAQHVVDNFACRYGVEPIYQAMTHFSCLSWKYKCPGIPPLMSMLLANIIGYFTQGSDKEIKTKCSELAIKQFEASKFGTEKFIKLLDNLHNSLRIDLTMYRKNYPASDPQRVEDLKASVDLLTTITFFRLKIQGQPNPQKVAPVLKECVKACVGSTYRYIFMDQLDQITNQNQEEKKDLIEARKQDDSNEFSSPPLNTLDFWNNLITLLVTMIEEDRDIYNPAFKRINNFSVVNVTSAELWRLFSEDLRSGMEEHAQHMLCSDNEYINLQFKVKFFWNQYVADTEEYADVTADYSKWFKPFTLHWLSSSEVFALNFVDGAYKRDKKEEFQWSAEHSRFSCSVVDTFTQLNQSIDIIIKLECTDVVVLSQYMHRFAETIQKVLTRYVAYVRVDFPKYCRSESVACILMNNIQQLRVQVEKIYQTMGGKQLDEKACEILEKLQFDLNQELDHLSVVFGQSFSNSIEASVKVAGKHLSEIKTIEERDLVVRPIADLLSESLEMFSKTCEKTILKRVLKELWKLVLKSMEKIIVLPPLSGITGPQLLLSAAKELGQLSKLKDINREDMSKTLTPKQCTVLNSVLDELKSYFHANGGGLKNVYLDKSEDLQSLKYALSLYTQTTDDLIKIFIQSQTEQDEPSIKNPLGQVTSEIKISTHPGTGEHTVSVKVVSVDNIKWRTSNMFRPFVEVNITGPHLSNRKRKFATKTKGGSWSPVYNEIFYFNLSNEDDVSSYEVQFCIKDYYFAREDRFIGLAIMPLKVIAPKASSVCMCSLGESINMNQTGWTILRILSQRSGDEVAKEFVQLKSSSRSAEEKLAP